MAKKRVTQAQMPNIADAESLGAWTYRFLEWMQVRNYSPRSVEEREQRLHVFARWCNDRSIVYPQEVTKPILERYQKPLFYRRSARSGRPMGVHAQLQHLVSVRMLFKWLTRQNVLLYNPASELELPRLTRSLPKHVLTPTEAEAILNQPNVHDDHGLRDRAILEVFYSTGIRRRELVNLDVFDADFERGVLAIRQGKGDKDRFVPLGERAGLWLQKYLYEARAQLMVESSEHAMFVSNTGVRFSPTVLGNLVHGYVEQAELSKSGSCHLFRHTMATVMHEGGADIRDIQAILGHVRLDTTMIYTRVGIERLQRVHAATHPGSLLKPLAKARPKRAEESTEPATEIDLITSLAAEAEDEA